MGPLHGWGTAAALCGVPGPGVTASARETLFAGGEEKGAGGEEEPRFCENCENKQVTFSIKEWSFLA